jgi:hypothetical protein
VLANEVLERAFDADDNLSEDTKRFIDRHVSPGEKRPPAPSVRRAGFSAEKACMRPSRLLEVSCQRDIGAGHGEHVARRRADRLPALCPIDKAAAAGVAVTVTELPSANVPAPLTVP